MGSLCKRKTATARLKSGLMAAQPGRLPNTFLYSGCNAVWAFQSVATTCLQGTRKVEETCPTKPCGPVLSGTSILTLKSGYPFMQMESRKPFLANGFTVFKKNEENLHDPDGKEKKKEYYLLPGFVLSLLCATPKNQQNQRSRRSQRQAPCTKSG